LMHCGAPNVLQSSRWEWAPMRLSLSITHDR
jgi:hypothetical protein